MATQLLLSLVFLSLLSLCSSIPSRTISNAVEILSDSDLVSMALILEFAPQTLIPKSQFLTIFSPPDAEFSKHGQPSLSLLRFHFSLGIHTLQSLKSLSSGSKITTLFSNHSLIITSSPSDNQVSLNGVKIGGAPTYDDGYLIVFKTDTFFDPDFNASKPGEQSHHGPKLGCAAANLSGVDNSFDKASGLLRSKGYSAMASFLDLQLEVAKEHRMLTIFAPSDEMMKRFRGKWKDFPSMFLKHVVPCKIPGISLAAFDDGTVLQTYLQGFNITIAKTDRDVMTNGVLVSAKDMYHSNSIVVHGLHGNLDKSGIAENYKGIKILMATSCLFLHFISFL